MSTTGDGKKIVKSFAQNLSLLIELSEQGEIEKLNDIMEENTKTMAPSFLQLRMRQAKAIDDVMSTPSMKIK